MYTNASQSINNTYSERCIMKLRKDAKNIQGQVFGDLTVLYPFKKGKIRGIIWKCLCICGKETDAYGGHLRAQKRKSCGCRSYRFIDETGVNRLISGYKRKCKLRNREFSLNRNEFSKLVKSNCFYCGSEPAQILKQLKTRKLQTIYNGIDRIDSDKGYVSGNCVSACRYCNQAKSDLSIEQFKCHIKRICKWLSIDI